MIIIIATEDIVAGTLIPSSVLMILFASADILTKMLSPSLIRKISFLLTIILIAFVWLISYVFMVAFDNVVVRLVGVFSYGIGNGFVNILLILLLC